MIEVLIKALQLILSLSILVIIHELGHFTFARLFNTRVEKFRLFFDPWFAIWKKKFGETEYGIGWLPLGGYVKISGMIDESMDKEQMKQPEQPWEFRAKPSWQRLLIMLGGVLFNIILAYTIYIFVMWTWGDKFLPMKNMTYGVDCSATAKEVGFQNGDKILKLGKDEAVDFIYVNQDLRISGPIDVTIDRNGNQVIIPISNDDIKMFLKTPDVLPFTPRVPFVIAKFVKDSGAEVAGLKVDDKIIAIEGDSLMFYDQITARLSQIKEGNVNVCVVRKNDTLNVPVKLDGNGKLGVYSYPPQYFFEFETIDYNFFTAIPAGISKGTRTVKDYIKQVKMIFTPKTEAYKSLGGFIAIGNIFPSTWHWESFWSLTAFLSIILAVMNILPIPALDGGHVMLLLYEMITRRKPSEKFLEYAQIVGLVLIMGLVLFANLNDIFRHFK